MDALFRKSDRLLANTSTEIIREKMGEIHWNTRLISIMGAKGVGKSTLIRQYLKQNYKPLDRSVLYCSADTVDFSTRTLVDLAEEFVVRGGELLVIDEIHKYKSGTTDWSREIKEIYDLFPQLRMIVSGSSLLRLRGCRSFPARYQIHDVRSFLPRGLAFLSRSVVPQMVVGGYSGSSL